jgi:hypothetical protein
MRSHAKASSAFKRTFHHRLVCDSPTSSLRPGCRNSVDFSASPSLITPTSLIRMIAHIGMLLASRTHDSIFRRYHDTICERFWRGELDIEDTAIAAEAEERGVFGVPTFLLHETGELFWGTDRVWLLRERLSDKL